MFRGSPRYFIGPTRRQQISLQNARGKGVPWRPNFRNRSLCARRSFLCRPCENRIECPIRRIPQPRGCVRVCVCVCSLFDLGVIFLGLDGLVNRQRKPTHLQGSPTFEASLSTVALEPGHCTGTKSQSAVSCLLQLELNHYTSARGWMDVAACPVGANFL